MLDGDGYRYLLRGIADHEGVPGASAVTAYYAQPGNPPGRWIGSGLARLGDGRGLRAASIVSEQQLEHLFHAGTDPHTGRPLGRAFHKVKPWRERVDARVAAIDPHLTDNERRALVERIEAGERSRAVARPVAGFDVTFSPPKSVSVLWGLSDQGVREQIYEAHQAALNDVLAVIERDVARTRIGANGVARVETLGVIAAAFDHWDSRSGDPQLHTHVLIANRVQGAHDGKWRTLDSRGALFPSTVAMSELYDTLLADHITARLGIGWENRGTKHKAKNTAWELQGVPAELIAAFSTRGADIEAEKDRLIESYRRDHGRTPNDTTILRLRQVATLATRPAKEIRPLSELTAEWRERAQVVLGEYPADWAARVTRFDGREHRTPSFRMDDLATIGAVDSIAAEAFSELSTERSTWTRWNVRAAVARASMRYRMTDAAERDRLIATAADHVVAMSIDLTPPTLAHTPKAFRRIDGASVFAPSRVFTATEVIEAEQRLLAAGRILSAPSIRLDDIDQATFAAAEGILLSDDQADATIDIAASGRRVDVLLGPAGVGKTTTLAALRAAWEAAHGAGSVIGLAPSAVAADVLADALEIGTENTAKWLYESRVRPVESQSHQWRFQPGQLVIVDEASMVGTLALDAIVTYAAAAGAKVLLVGDYAQLGSVDAGGAFGMLVRDRGEGLVPELRGVRRFHADWERSASVRLRVGDTTVLDTYDQHDRIHGSEKEAMLDDALAAWRADEATGKTSLLIAASNDTVRDLNTRARLHLVDTGAVETYGAVLHDGTLAGAGDRVVTRHNDRRLTTGRGWVKNGDTWRVLARHADGSLTVQRLHAVGTITLPAAYVREHVEPAYATTAHRAQGTTVDTAHVLVTGPSMTREVLYVAMTRAREANHAYVALDTIDEDQRHLNDDPEPTPLAVLAQVLRRRGAAMSATETAAELDDQSRSIGQLADEYTTIAAHATAHRWDRIIDSCALPDTTSEPATSPAYPALAAAMAHAEASGHDVAYLLPKLAAARELDSADDPIAVLHHRLEGATDRPTPRRHRRSGRWIVGMIPAATNVTDPELVRALRDRERLIDARADELLERARSGGEPWLARLGKPPQDEASARAWQRCAVTVAAFREHYDVTDPERPLGDLTAVPGHQLRRAREAWTNACQLSGDKGRRQSAALASTRPSPPALTR